VRVVSALNEPMGFHPRKRHEATSLGKGMEQAENGRSYLARDDDPDETRGK
jgi:hypothetical protein